MDRGQAAVLLGVEVTSSKEDAKRAYLARAKILHPDRFTEGSDADRSAATAAMAQLNHAYEVFIGEQGEAHRGAARSTESHEPSQDPDAASIVVCESCGQRNRVQDGVMSRCGTCGDRLSHSASGYSGGSDTPSGQGGSSLFDEFPLWPFPATACQFCGWGPATEVKFHSVLGIIIWWRWSTIQARLCRECGSFVYHGEQAKTLVTGWWGLLAPLVNVIAFVSNMIRYRSIKALPAPQGKSPEILSLVPVPMFGVRPWFTRPGPVIVGGLVLAFTVWVIAGIATAGSTSSIDASSVSTGPGPGSDAPAIAADRAGEAPSSAPFPVGTCLTEFQTDFDGLILQQPDAVPCDGEHLYEVSAVTVSPASAYDEEAILAQADAFCSGPSFTSYVGVPFSESVLDVSYNFPSFESWAAGDRVITCLVLRPGETKGSTPLRGSRQ